MIARSHARAQTEPAGAAPTLRRPFRIGHGYDIHRLQPGGKRCSAASSSSDQISPIAHSDGDVVIHAMVDATARRAWGGATSASMFPDTRCCSGKAPPAGSFFENVTLKVREAGYRVVNADVTILAENAEDRPAQIRDDRNASRAVSAVTRRQYKGRDERRLRRCRPRRSRSPRTPSCCSPGEMTSRSE